MTTNDLTAVPEPAAASPPDAWWRHVRAALRGAHYDYTDGPVGRSLWLLAIPMVLETLMESLFAICDVFFVSRLGADAVATVGLTESMLTMLYALAMGLSIGATATVARRIGEKDPDGAARAAVQAIALGVAVSLAHRRGWRRRRAGAAARHGRLAVDRRNRQHLHAGHARRQRHGGADLPHQRGVPRRRRRGDRDAGAVAGQRTQHRAGAVPRLRAGAVPGARRHRRRRRHQPRPRHRRRLPALALSRRRGGCGSRRATSASTRR